LEDIFNINNIIEDLDKKITIKEIKRKGRNKTIMSGICTYSELNNDTVIKNIVKDIKTKHGCSSSIEKDSTGTFITFHGNQKTNIINYFKIKYPQIVISV